MALALQDVFYIGVRINHLWALCHLLSPTIVESICIYIYSLVHDVVHGSMAQAGTTWNPVLNSAVENGQDQADQVGCDKKARVISISFVLTSASSSIAVFVCTLAVCCSAGCSTSWTGTTGRRPLPRPRSFQNETCRVIVYE